ncbi:MAG: hypothetical protein F8N36_14130 [Desulfovibrio sp.]|uniref:hypothetical protein n=1 Tax=Desulfovibrio sp. TaxID=885 RepID=UPI00135E41D8|nr:hypothetical protein [Desulfovibrio sp.]MTJ93977.1 hypothetical protein [Desulfovibrio sp.]
MKRFPNLPLRLLSWFMGLAVLACGLRLWLAWAGDVAAPGAGGALPWMKDLATAAACLSAGGGGLLPFFSRRWWIFTSLWQVPLGMALEFGPRLALPLLADSATGENTRAILLSLLRVMPFPPMGSLDDLTRATTLVIASAMVGTVGGVVARMVALRQFTWGNAPPSGGVKLFTPASPRRTDRSDR